MDNFLYFKNIKNFYYSIFIYFYKKGFFYIKILSFYFFLRIFIFFECIQFLKFIKIQTYSVKKLIIKKKRLKYKKFIKNNLSKKKKNKINFFSKNYLCLNFITITLPIKIKKSLYFKKKILILTKKKIPKFLKKNKSNIQLKKNYLKKFISCFDFDLPEYQQYQGYFNQIGKRIKKFSLIWDEAQWILFLFKKNNEKENIFPHYNEISNYLDNLFMILVYIQTGKINNFFFSQKQKYYKKSIKDNFIQLSFFYRIFILDRIWNAKFSKRQKINFILKHLSYTSDLSFEYILNLKREYFNLALNDYGFYSLYKKIFIASFILNTKNQTCLTDFNSLTKSKFDFIKVKKFCILNKNTINFIKKTISCYGNFLIKLNSDLRIWHIYCLDSYLCWLDNKIEVGFFLIFLKNIKNFLFDFLLGQIYKKLFNFKKKESRKFYLNQVELLNFSDIKSVYLLENSRKINFHLNKNFHIKSLIYFSKKKFSHEIKVLFAKIFKSNISFSFVFLLKTLYFISSYWYFHIFLKMLKFEINTNINEILISKFYKLFIAHGTNLFNPYHDQVNVVSNSVCFIEIYSQALKHFNNFFQISFSFAKSFNLKKIKKFKISIQKKILSDIFIFFCAKYRVNFIVIGNNSFLERSISIFLKIQLFKYLKIDNYSITHSVSIKKNKIIKYIQIFTLEKNTIIFNIANSNIIINICPDYSKRILFLVLNFLEKNISAYSFLLIGKKFDINVKINQKIYNFKYERLYRILLFVYFFVFSKIKININYTFNKNKREALILLNILGRRKGEKLCKKLLNIYNWKRNKIFRFTNHLLIKLITKDNWLIFVFLFYIKSSFYYENLSQVVLLSCLPFYKKNTLSVIFNNPFILKDFKKIVYKHILKKNSSKYFKFNINNEFYNFLNKTILSYSSSNFIKKKLKKNIHFSQFLENKKKIIFLKRYKIFLIRSWKEKILLNHQIGKILIINNIHSFNNSYIFGILNTGFSYFIKEHDFFFYNLKFKNFIKNKLSVFPARITAIYPSIMKIRLSVDIDTKYIS